MLFVFSDCISATLSLHSDPPKECICNTLEGDSLFYIVDEGLRHFYLLSIMNVSILCVILLTAGIQTVLAAQAQPKCTVSSCPLSYFNTSNDKKVNAPYTFTLGSLYDNAVDSNSLVSFAIALINNDTTILPNVRLDLYP